MVSSDQAQQETRTVSGFVVVNLQRDPKASIYEQRQVSLWATYPVIQIHSWCSSLVADVTASP